MTDTQPVPTNDGDKTLRAIVTIANKRGLHARASAKFVKRAESFNAAIHVSREGMTVLGTSIMGLMMLAASPGSQIELSVSGPEAEKAMAAMIALVEGKFDED